MFKLQCVQKISDAEGNKVVFNILSTNENMVMYGSLTVVTTEDNFTVGKEYAADLQEIV